MSSTTSNSSEYGPVPGDCINLSLHAEVYVDTAGVVKQAFAFASLDGTIISRIDLNALDSMTVGAVFRSLGSLGGQVLERASDNGDKT